MEFNRDWEDMNNLFSKSTFTSLDFTRLFFATALKNKIRYIKFWDYIEGIYELNKRDEFKELVQDIGFRTSGKCISSTDLGEGISHMCLFGYINLRDNAIYVLCFDEEKMINEFPEDKQEKMETLVCEFKKIQSDRAEKKGNDNKDTSDDVARRFIKLPSSK